MELPSSIPIRLPDMTLFNVDISGISYLLIKDLKYLLYQQGVGVFPRKIKLIHKHRILGDVEDLSTLQLRPGEPICLVIRVLDDEKAWMKWDEFMSSVPKHNAINIPIHATMRLQFHQNQIGHVVFTPCMVDFNELGTLVAQKEEIGKWMDLPLQERVLLLQVEESLELRLESVRYDMEKERQGCADSWQRYTSLPPISCGMTVTPFYQALPHELVLTPHKPLQYNTHYAVVLLNNIPTVPWQHPVSSWHYLSSGIGEDKVIIFRTERQPTNNRLTVVKGMGGGGGGMGTRSNSGLSVMS